MHATLAVGLISDTFFGPDGAERLRDRLADAKQRGAEVCLLPELPLDPWVPATQDAREEDAEPVGGPRHRAMAAAAADVGIGLIGGAIVRSDDGRRHNTALAFAADGSLVGVHRKSHLPEEPGFWETSHYVPGDDSPAVVEAFALPFGMQTCSDINRPAGTQILAALGAMAILAPRATELATYPRWQLVFRANALTTSAYVLSVNRPRPEFGVPIGGPSICVAPNGEIALETTDPVAVVTLESEAVSRARVAYPGYLPVRARLYADAWRSVAERDG